ncbi:MAG: methyltransferase [Burkholderiales bacterium]|nr:methyltransferase [Burkholderiales bacterium]
MQMTDAVTPAGIMQLGMGFWASKTLLSAVELELFTALADGPLTGGELEKRLGLHPRATYDFLDTLVAVHMLEREGNGPGARYKNTPETGLFLNKKGPTYIGGILEMSNARLYKFWSDLTEALKTGKPQNEIKHTGKQLFEELYAEPARLEQFMNAMDGVSMGNFMAFAEKFDFGKVKTHLDVGGATGQLAMAIARRHPTVQSTTADLPVVQPIAERHVQAAGLSKQVQTKSMDFFKDDFPAADLITMGMILHDWNLENKKMLIRKAFKAVNPGGAFVAIENIIDDERRQNAFGLMMSLNMLIEFGEAFDFTGADFKSWCLEAGFKRVEILSLAGPASAAIAYK